MPNGNILLLEVRKTVIFKKFAFRESETCSSLFSMRDCQMLVEYFDMDKDGALCYQE